MVRPFRLMTSLAALLVAVLPASARAAEDGWQVSTSLYLWASAFDNEVTDNLTGAATDSSASFGDILDNLKGVFIGKAEAQYGRAGAFADLVYLHVSADQTTIRPILGPIEREADIETTTATVAGFYRVIESDGLDVDLIGGLRYIKLKLDLDVQGGGPGLNAEASVSKTEPILGVRAIQALGSRSSITGYADYGGFSDTITVWQLVGTYNYQWKPNLAVFGGYRHFVIEVDKDRLSADTSFSGPVLGLTYSF